MKTTTLLTAILFAAFFISCKNKHNQTEDLKTTDASVMQPNVPLAEEKIENQQLIKTPAFAPAADTALGPLPVTTVSDPGWDKKIIKTAKLSLEVKDFKSYTGSIHNTIKKYGGYIAQEEQNLSDEKSESVLSIKVPVAQFETMMNELPAGAVKTLERKITTEDVSSEVVDTRSRLEAKKEMRLKYLEFLKQSKNMAEVLQVQNEINNIQEEIEAAAGRVSYLSHQSAYSTINLTFFQPFEGFKPTNTSPSFFSRIADSFKTGTAWIGDLMVALTSIWPLILIVLAILLTWKRSRKPIPAKS